MTRQYHIQLNGTGFMLQEQDGRVAYREGTQDALSIKTAQGDPKYSDQSHLSVWNQVDWRGGRGENRAEAGNRYSDASMTTWIKEHLMMRPLRRIVGIRNDGTTGAFGTISGSPSILAYLQSSAPTRKEAQSFTLSANTSISHVTLLLSLEDTQMKATVGTLTVRIETDSAGAPSGTLASGNLTGTFAITSLSPLWTWCKIAFTGAFTLTASTTYWIVISCASHTAVAEPRWGRGGQTTAYSSGEAQRYDGSAWSSSGLTGTDYYFYFEERTKFASTPVVGIDFNSQYYLAVGTQLYKWDNTNFEWDAVGDPLANAITDMDVLGSTLWISTGKGNNAYSMNTSETITVQTGILGQMVQLYGGFLYRANGNQLFYTSDGTNWTSTDADGNTFLFGNTNYNITGMAGLGDSLYVAKPDGLFSFEPGDFVERVARWDTMFDSNNGTGMVEWNGALYIPVKHGLVKYDGKGNFDPDIGPDQDEGLPADRLGKIAMLIPLLNYLIVAVDATASDEYGSVLLYNKYGWHELGRAWRAGERVQMVGYSPTFSLFFYAMGGHMAVLPFSDVSDNIAAYVPANVEWTGYLETSWISGGLLDVWKLLSSAWINFDTALYTYVDYRVDRDDDWRHLGRFSYVGGEEIDFKTADDVDSPGTATGIVGNLVTLSAIGTIVAGNFVRLGHETRYVLSVGGVTTLTLQVPYERAAVGDQAYGGFPTCREVQLRIRSSVTGTTTPRIRAVRLNWANQLTRWRRWQMTIKCETDMKLLDGTHDTTRSAATIYNDLMEMLSGSTLFVLNDIDGVDRTVQIVNAQVSEPEIKYDVPGVNFSAQRSVTLDVVEI